MEKTLLTIWAPPYDHKSGGIRALYRLGEELNKKSINTSVGTEYALKSIAMYPEVVTGNPFNAEKVVRWVLNKPGYLGGEKEYDPKEMIFSWDKKYYDAPILKVKNLEDDLFVNKHFTRNRDCCFVGKGIKRISGTLPLTKNLDEITDVWPAQRAELVNLFNNTRTFYTYDDNTQLSLEALLCGCKVILLPENKELFIKDMDYFYKNDYEGQLDNFIKILKELI